ncbi:MAG: hypothetical protein WBQ33_08805 [Candidatus Binatus sp.]
MANQHVHPDGRGYQEFTQHCRVRGYIDLDFANVRVDRSYPRTEDAGAEVTGVNLQMKLKINRHVTNQPPHQRRFFQQPSGVRREAMGETAGIRETPPSLGARQLFPRLESIETNNDA